VHPRLLIVASLIAVPVAAGAQRGGSRTQSDRHTDLFEKTTAPKGPLLRSREIEDQSPLKVLLDKRRDLKLTDAQLSQLEASKGKLAEKNAPLLKMVDSLVRDLRSVQAASEGDQAHLRMVYVGLTNVLGEVRSNYDAAAKDALATLDADQQAKAAELLDKQKEDVENFMKERLGGGQRSGGA